MVWHPTAKARQFGMIFIFASAIFGSLYNHEHAKASWDWMNDHDERKEPPRVSRRS